MHTFSYSLHKQYLPYVFVFLSLLFLGCSPEPPVRVEPLAQYVSFERDVQPILNKRCVVCHSCYNAPCQLKLGSFEGLMRGTSKKSLYDTRLHATQPTRLFVDAHNIDDWRSKGFSSVVHSQSQHGLNDSILMHTLFAKKKHPQIIGKYAPEHDDLSCAKDSEELLDFLDDDPQKAMPYGFPALTQKEYQIITTWLDQGANAPEAKELLEKDAITHEESIMIRLWEGFLNTPIAKYQMSARYLYEHLFIAHLQLQKDAKHFFRVVRSMTPPGEPIREIATVRPYDAPGFTHFYYRLQKVPDTIVYKTHITFDASRLKYKRIKELFIKSRWSQPPHLISYNPKLSANPFMAFAQIPTRVRYRFLLDNSEYFVRTFIRGPVCKGQIALNVINDKFWVFFLNPKYDLSVQDEAYFNTQLDNLDMPIEIGSDYPLIEAFSDKYIRHNINYFRARETYYEYAYANGLDYDAIWSGEESDDAPALTVLRHFDSASVHKGLHGNLPRTAWVIDFPLFERIYYNLVAGFDVFGDVGHQVNVRKYFNGSRYEGEAMFLDFLPQSSRRSYFNAWYQNMDSDMFSNLEIPQMKTHIAFNSSDYFREFMQTWQKRHEKAIVPIAFDWNYHDANASYPEFPTTFSSRADFMQAFQSLNRPGSNFVKYINGYGSNVAYIRIKMGAHHEEDIVVTVVINRWHDNVAFMFNESSRLNPKKDTADFYTHQVGAYPNAFFVVDFKELPEFLHLLYSFDNSKEDIKSIDHFLLERSSKEFWQEYDWFQHYFDQKNGSEAGLFDLNRYAPEASLKALYEED